MDTLDVVIGCVAFGGFIVLCVGAIWDTLKDSDSTVPFKEQIGIVVIRDIKRLFVWQLRLV